LFILTADPRTSHRPAEAVRIAVGLMAWQKVNPILYLEGPAANILSDDTDDFIDAEIYRQHLAAVVESQGHVYLAENSAPLTSSLRAQPISSRALAELAAQASSVLHF
jgi:hypothetical protein